MHTTNPTVITAQVYRTPRGKWAIRLVPEYNCQAFHDLPIADQRRIKRKMKKAYFGRFRKSRPYYESPSS